MNTRELKIKELVAMLMKMDQDKPVRISVNVPVPGGTSMRSGSLGIKEEKDRISFIVQSH